MATIGIINNFRAEFERFDKRRRASDPEWLASLRHRAFDRFSALGFPTTRQEEWRFTNVTPIAEGRFTVWDPPSATPAWDPASLSPEAGAAKAEASAQIDSFHLTVANAIELVFVNGRFAPALSRLDSLPNGLVAGPLADVLKVASDRAVAQIGRHAQFEDDAFAALNTAFLSDGARIDLAPNTVLDRPVHVLFVAVSARDAAPAIYPRVLVMAGRNSQMTLVETYAGVGGHSFTNAVTEIVLGDGSVVDHYRVQREPADAYHVSATAAHLAHTSVLTDHSFTFGGALVRNNINIVMAAEGGDCTLNGLYLVDGSRLVDNHTFIDHAQPHCSSHEVYKGVLADRSRAIFNGKILVRPDAQKTDAKQTNKTLLLSDDAQINTKPQLEIYANDVKCTHGATVGQLSADALFYLQARGIDKAEARNMLIRAFAADITSRVRVEPLRDVLDQLLLARLEGGRV